LQNNVSKKSWRRKMKKLTILMVFLLFSGCATTGPGGKKSFILISTNEEISIGEKMAAQVEQEEKVSKDTVVQEYVNSVGQGIAGISDRKELPYHFKVLESDQINAFACPAVLSTFIPVF
jgi:predicted Zn-dependent protease